jgi:predicted Rossmann fold flavoprotein
MLYKNMRLGIIGGGAAGFFSAVIAAQCNSSHQILLLEKNQQLLSKVRISGGGRCNVTHACFDPSKLVENYPRGYLELKGPFHSFHPQNTMEWFESRGVALKIEEDGRVFPVTDSSQSVIDCLLSEAKKNKIEICLRQKIMHIEKNEKCFHLKMESGEDIVLDRVLLATGSHAQGHLFAASLGHTIVPPVPSLFTFNLPESPLLDLSGLSVKNTILKLEGSSLKQEGPLLLTHWGFSGPAVLKLSAWGARFLHQKNYQTAIKVNWTGIEGSSRETFLAWKKSHGQSQLSTSNPFEIARNLWKRLLQVMKFNGEKRWSELSQKELHELEDCLKNDVYTIQGKTLFKEEFVTCGGVSLKEIHFKTMESKLCPGLFFAGEILDIDGVTGGFNFQNAWTTGWLAGRAMSIDIEQ